MKITLTIKTISIALLSATLVGMFLGSMLTWKCGKRQVISTIDTLMIREFKHDTSVVYDTIVVSKYDTLFIEPTTPIGEIPMVMKLVQDSLPLDVYGNRIYIPFNLGMHYRGILYSYYVATKPQPFVITSKRRVVNLFGGAFAYVNQSYRISGEIVGGMRFFDHYAIISKAELDNDMKGNIKLGVGYVF